MMVGLLALAFLLLMLFGAISMLRGNSGASRLFGALAIVGGAIGLLFVRAVAMAVSIAISMAFELVEQLVVSAGGIEGLLFCVFAALTCFGAVAVVVTQNVVRMAFWLVVSLGSVAALFFLLHADFIGAAQLLIYVGGTVVLLVFGVMLTASGPTVQIRTSPAESFLGAGVGLLLLLVLLFSMSAISWDEVEQRLSANSRSNSDEPQVVSKNAVGEADAGSGEGAVAALKVSTGGDELATKSPTSGKPNADDQAGRTVRQLGLSFLGLRPDRDLGKDAGAPLSPGFLLPFEIISIHLLVVLVGAAYLARAKRKVTPASSGEI